ncbi:MAG: MFS transporter [Microthrixaceae bacterium]
MSFAITPEQAHEKRWWTLGALCLALSIIGIDNTILNVALPKIVESVHAEGSQLQWIVDAYVIVFACLLLSAGTLGDKLGRKKTLLAGLAVFGLFSGLAATASTANGLIAFRALMGIGGALIFPSTLSVITNTFTGVERAKAIGIWAGVSGLGIAIGPLAGGLLVEHFFWGSVFLVNVPIVIIALVACYLVVPDSRDDADAHLDPVGALLSIVGLAALLYGIIEAPAEGWTDTKVLVGFAVGLAFGVGFFMWERRATHPMLDVTFFGDARFTAASATITLTFFALFGSTFLLTQYFQFVLGYSPFKSGMLTAPVAIGIMIAGPYAPRIVQRIGTKYTVMIGLFIVTGVLMSYASETLMSSVLWGSVVRFAFGLGMGTVMAPATESIMASLPLNKAGVGSAVNDTTRQAGGALGVAVIGSIFAARYHGLITPPKGLPHVADAAIRDSIGKALYVAADRRVPAPLARQIEYAASRAFVGGMQLAVFVGAAICLLAVGLAWRYLPMRTMNAEQAAAEAALLAEREHRGTPATEYPVPVLSREHRDQDATFA